MNISAVSVEGAMSGASYAPNLTSSDQSGPAHLASFANLEDHIDSDGPLSSFVCKDRLSKFDVIGREFSSIEDVEEFYFTYAKNIGFNVRRDIKRANSKGNVTIRRWVVQKKVQFLRFHCNMLGTDYANASILYHFGMKPS
ncbi:hypothetical protein WN943_003492 [Citrus x changshan-huyou]